MTTLSKWLQNGFSAMYYWLSWLYWGWSNRAFVREAIDYGTTASKMPHIEQEQKIREWINDMTKGARSLNGQLQHPVTPINSAAIMLERITQSDLAWGAFYKALLAADKIAIAINITENTHNDQKSIVFPYIERGNDDIVAG